MEIQTPPPPPSQWPVAEYIGETCKNLYWKSKAHAHNYRLLDPRSFIGKHHLRMHPERSLGDVEFLFSVKGHFPSAFRRQIAEVVAIKMSIGD